MQNNSTLQCEHPSFTQARECLGNKLRASETAGKLLNVRVQRELISAAFLKHEARHLGLNKCLSEHTIHDFIRKPQSLLLTIVFVCIYPQHKSNDSILGHVNISHLWWEMHQSNQVKCLRETLNTA